jgi:hypothetical protein
MTHKGNTAGGIVVEGPDGAGKSGLVQRIAEHLKIPVHARACKSTSGPIDQLYEWARHDVTSLRWQPFSVYDRHPLVSEYIYGPITRQSVSPQFYTRQAAKLSEQFAHQVLIVYCDPGVGEVLENVLKGKHMDGVAEHASRLYYAYKSFMHYWPGNRPVVWDYTQPHTFPEVIQKCVEFYGIHNMEGAQA